MARRKRTDFIVLHCSASPPTADLGVREIRAMHKRIGWSDIGYHVVIKRDGTIENGRPIYDIGSHVKGFNANSVGVCLVGGVDAKGRAVNNFTPAQWASLKIVLDDLTAKFPAATVLGHRDFSPDRDRDGTVEPQEWIKQCPCFDARSWAKKNGYEAALAKPLAFASLDGVVAKPKPVMQHRRTWASLTGWLGGAGAGIIGMFSGWDWMAILVICAFVTFWLLLFLYLYRQEIRDGLFSGHADGL